MTQSSSTAAYPTCPFKAGDRVMFSRRCQTTAGGMPVEDVDINMFDVLLKVDGKWWHPESFMTFEEWKRQCARTLN
jgi:hypothetical protein